jgi:hypothetical protein
VDEHQFSLSDLESIEDDLDVSMDPDTYQDQASPAPLVAGIYRGRVISHSKRMEQDGSLRLVDGKFPIIILAGVELVEGVENPPRKVYPFKEITTKPFERPFGSGRYATALGDFTRAFDQTRGWNGTQEGIRLLLEYFESGQLFTASYNWSVYDKEFVEAAREQLGLVGPQSEESAKKLLNAVYKAARVEGMNNFPPLRSGFPNHVYERGNVVVKHPVSGASIVIEAATRYIEAKLVMTRVFPSLDERVRIGASAYKPRVQQAA